MVKTKKAIQAILTTSLAITPVLAYTPSAEAATPLQSSYSSVTDWVDNMNTLYDYLSDAQKADLLAARTAVQSDTTWNDVLSSVAITGLTDLEKRGLTEKLSAVLYSNSTNELTANIDAFRTYYSDNGIGAKLSTTTADTTDDPTADDVLSLIAGVQLSVFNQLKTFYNNNSNSFDTLSNSDLAGIYLTAFDEAKTNFSTQQSSVSGNIDIDVLGIASLFISLRSISAVQTAENTIMSAYGSLLAASTGGGGGGGAVPPTTDDTTSEQGQIIVDNGVAQVVKEATADGKTTVHVQLSVDDVTKAIGNKAFEKLTIQTTKGAKGEVTQVELPAEAFEIVASKNKNAVIEVATDGAAYQLPAKEIDKKALAASLGTTTDDVTIEVAVNEIAQADVQETVAKNNLTPVSKVFEFTVSASSKNGNRTEIKKFTQYVERNIEGEQNFDAVHATAVILNEDGSITPVPTRFTGKSAVILSRSNSKYTVVENNVTFSDITDKWYEVNVEKLASKYIINGTGANQYSPNSTTTRAQLTALLVRSLGLAADGNYDGKFNDVNGNEWFAKELTVAVDAGIIDGFEDGTFRPNEVVTREQAAAMIRRAMSFTTFDQTKLDDSKNASMKYKDYASVSTWATSDVETMTEAGIMQGNANGTFEPKDGTSRGEMAAVIDRFLTFVNFIN